MFRPETVKSSFTERSEDSVNGFRNRTIALKKNTQTNDENFCHWEIFFVGIEVMYFNMVEMV